MFLCKQVSLLLNLLSFFIFWLLITRTIPNWYRLTSFSTCLKVAWMRLWHIQMVWEGTGAGTGVTCAYTRTIPFYCYEISNHRHSRQTCGLFWQTWMKLWGTVSQKVIRLHWDRERVKCYDLQWQQKLNTKDPNRIHRRLPPNTHGSRAESGLLIKDPGGNGNKWHPKKPLKSSNRTTDLGSELHPQGIICRFISQKLTTNQPGKHAVPNIRLPSPASPRGARWRRVLTYTLHKASIGSPVSQEAMLGL